MVAKTQLNVRIDSELDSRLAALAKRAGRTKSFYVVEAIKEFLEDQEDYYLAMDSLAEFNDSGEAALDMEDVVWGNTDVCRVGSNSRPRLRILSVAYKLG